MTCIACLASYLGDDIEQNNESSVLSTLNTVRWIGLDAVLADICPSHRTRLDYAREVLDLAHAAVRS